MKGKNLLLTSLTLQSVGAKEKPVALNGLTLTVLSSLFRKVKENWKPGDVLLSHGEAPHYHRRCYVSLLSSAWSQVGP